MPIPWSSKAPHISSSPASKRYPGTSPRDQLSSAAVGCLLQFPPRNSRERLISTGSELHYRGGGSLSTSKHHDHQSYTRSPPRGGSESLECSPTDATVLRTPVWVPARVNGASGERRKWHSSLGVLLLATALVMCVAARYWRRPQKVEQLDTGATMAGNATLLASSQAAEKAGVSTTLPLEFAVKVSRAYNELGAKLQQVTSHGVEAGRLELKHRQKIDSHLDRLDAAITQLKQDRTVQVSKLDTALQLQQRNLERLHEAVTELDAKVRSLSATAFSAAPVEEHGRGDGSSSNSRYLETFEEFRDDVLDKLSRIELSLYQDDSDSIDWARASLGARIDMHYTSTALGARSSLVKMMEVVQRLYKLPESFPPEGRSPDVVIGGNSDNRIPVATRPLPGNCFSFKGSQGNVTIILPAAVNINDVRVEHVARSINPSWTTAPKNVAVFIDNPEAVMLFGESASSPLFPRTAPATQVAELELDYPETSLAVATLNCGGGPRCKSRRIRFEILSNYGGKYTCIYRFRVFGTLALNEVVEAGPDEEAISRHDEEVPCDVAGCDDGHQIW